MLDAKIKNELNLVIKNSQIDGFDNFKNACKISFIYTLQQNDGTESVQKTTKLPSHSPNVIFILSEECMYKLPVLLKTWTTSKLHEYHSILFSSSKIFIEQSKTFFHSVQNLPFQLFPVSNDIFTTSLEPNADFLKSTTFEGKSQIASLISMLEAYFGGIPQVYAKGKEAEDIFSFYKKRQENYVFDGAKSGLVDVCLIVSRDVDFLSAVNSCFGRVGLDQESFESLMFELESESRHNNEISETDDENSGSNPFDEDSDYENNHSTDIVETRTIMSSLRKFGITSTSSFLEVRQSLAKLSKNLSMKENTLKAEDLGDQLKLVKTELRDFQADKIICQKSIFACEQINKKVENSLFFDQIQSLILEFVDTISSFGENKILELINSVILTKQLSFTEIIRLIIMHGQISGISEKCFDRLEGNIVASFGYDKLSCLIGLKSLGITDKNGFPFKNIDSKTGLSNFPSNIVELAYKVCTPGWRVIGQELGKIRGKSSQLDRSQPIQNKSPRNILVVVPGGLRYSELIEFRRRAAESLKVSKMELRFYIITTGLLSSSSIVQALACMK